MFDIPLAEGLGGKEALEDMETRSLEEMTFEPASYLEGRGEFQQAETLQVSLEAVIVNAVADRDGRFSRLGAQIAAALPRLRGYVGVDIVAADAGPVVLEVNPRLTTSCSGLRAALGLNVAALELGLPDSLAGLTAPGATGRPVEIRPEVPLAT